MGFCKHCCFTLVFSSRKCVFSTNSHVLYNKTFCLDDLLKTVFLFYVYNFFKCFLKPATRHKDYSSGREIQVEKYSVILDLRLNVHQKKREGDSGGIFPGCQVQMLWVRIQKYRPGVLIFDFLERDSAIIYELYFSRISFPTF